jgi:hypothetical protein
MVASSAGIANFCPKKLMGLSENRSKMIMLNACDSNPPGASIVEYLIMESTDPTPEVVKTVEWEVLNQIHLNFLGDIKSTEKLGVCATGKQYLVWNQIDANTVTLVGVDSNQIGAHGIQNFDTKNSKICGPLEMRCVDGTSAVVMIGKDCLDKTKWVVQVFRGNQNKLANNRGAGIIRLDPTGPIASVQVLREGENILIIAYDEKDDIVAGRIVFVNQYQITVKDVSPREEAGTTNYTMTLGTDPKGVTADASIVLAMEDPSLRTEVTVTKGEVVKLGDSGKYALGSMFSLNGPVFDMKIIDRDSDSKDEEKEIKMLRDDDKKAKVATPGWKVTGRASSVLNLSAVNPHVRFFSPTKIGQ